MSESENPHKRQERAANLFIWALAVVAALACIWRFTPLHHKITIETLAHWGDSIRGRPWTPLAVPLVFVLAAVVGFSHAALVWASVFIFPAWQAFLYSE